MKKKPFWIFLLLGYCFIFSVHAEISEPYLGKKVQEAEEHDVTITLKIVQVYVTDKEGNPVTV